MLPALSKLSFGVTAKRDFEEGSGAEGAEPSKRAKPEEDGGVQSSEETLPIGTVNMDDFGNSFVQTKDEERLFFENQLRHNPFRGLGSDVLSYAVEVETEDWLYFRAGDLMKDTTFDPQLVGPAFPVGARVSYVRYEPSQLEKVDGEEDQVAIHYWDPDEKRQKVRGLPLLDDFHAFAFNVEEVKE